MTDTPPESKDADILASAVASRRAARRAREIGRKTGTPVYVLKKGQIVDLTARARRRDRARVRRGAALPD